LDSSSQIKLDTLLNKWYQWTEDSANVIIFLKCYYYSGDTMTDPMFTQRIEACQKKLDALTEKLNGQGIHCEVIMQDIRMLIYNDEEEWFDQIQLQVVEYY
jgi:preprotein translocase subunit SecA